MSKQNAEPSATKEYHFFCSSAINWTVDEDLFKCLQRQKKEDRRRNSPMKSDVCGVYKVPVPIDTHYKIMNYAPQVEGAELIDLVYY